MDKVVICLWHSANKGKSATIREFAKLILDKYYKPRRKTIYQSYEGDTVPEFDDFILVVEINGIIFGIRSQGDPNTGVETELKMLANKYKCNIIVCASRTKGETVWAVEGLRGFEKIWTSTYQVADKSLQHKLNMLKAKQLMELIKNIGFIK
ncbi:hypothetical protein LQZ19_07105 [Treponema primitia]|uniref:hypothetical protein n=1 Tax=Treponema primitia TaxID=88058 RepID=UPI00397EF635